MLARFEESPRLANVFETALELTFPSSKMSEQQDFLVVGAGVAGLTFAMSVLEEGHRATIVERNDFVGGLARSFRYGDFIFDVGPKRFHTDDEEIRRRIEELEERLAAMPADAPAALRVAVEDNLRTSRERLANLVEARSKLAVVAAEIERLEAKIAALAEGAVARRDVSDIAQRVDEVAEGMRRTDETMRQLQLPPQLEEFDEPPALLREEA